MADLNSATWIYRGTWNTLPCSILEIEDDFTTPYLAILAESLSAKPNWIKAGYLSQLIELQGIGYGELKRGLFVPLNQLTIFDFGIAVSKYRLRFQTPDYLPNLNINIFEPDMPFYPSQDSSGTNTFTNTTVNVVNTAIRLIAANINRKAIGVANPLGSNANIYLGFENGVTASSSYVIKPGQTYLFDFNWTGEIWAISNKTTATAVGIQEFL